MTFGRKNLLKYQNLTRSNFFSYDQNRKCLIIFKILDESWKPCVVRITIQISYLILIMRTLKSKN